MTAERKSVSALPVDRPPADEESARLVLDDEGRIVYVSDSFASLACRPPEKLHGLYLASLLEFTDPATALNDDGAISEGTHRARLPGPSLLDDSQAAFLTLRFDRLTTQDGERYTIAAEMTDADEAGFSSERLHGLLEKGAAAPREKIGPQTDNAELRHFLDMSNDLLAVSSHEGMFLRVNGQLNSLLGYGDAELETMSFMDLIHPDDRASVRARVLRDEAEEIVDFEARVTARDGRVVLTEWRQKRSNGLLYSVGRDVTALKEQQAALEAQHQQLDEAQAIARMGHWRWIVGEDGIEWSGEIYRIFGVSRETFRPSLEGVNAMLHKRDVGRMLQAFQRAILDHADYEMDCRIVRPDGEVRTLRCIGKCQEDATGEVVALFGIMHDITQRMKYESDLRLAKESAERAYAAKSQFLANMSHELRTPLNAIIGFSEMMQRQLLGPIGTPRYLDYITGIRESGEHLLDLISDILDMSKIEAGKYELDLEEFNVAKTIKLAAHMMEGRAQEGSIRLTVTANDANLHIVADRRALMQILLNLLSNAVKFTEPGGTVQLECGGDGREVFLRVQDSGIGIPASKIAYITRPFEQAASHYTRGHQGTGLGLAITKDLTELHGGSLMIESAEGVGTAVTIRLPLDARPQLRKRLDKPA